MPSICTGLLAQARCLAHPPKMGELNGCNYPHPCPHKLIKGGSKTGGTPKIIIIKLHERNNN